MFRIGSILALWFAANAASQTVLELSKFGAHSGDGSDTTPAVRAALEKWYGKEKGSQVKHAEAFEVCEYGRQPKDEDLRKLFPMLQ